MRKGIASAKGGNPDDRRLCWNTKGGEEKGFRIGITLLLR